MTGQWCVGVEGAVNREISPWRFSASEQWWPLLYPFFYVKYPRLIQGPSSSPSKSFTVLSETTILKLLLDNTITSANHGGKMGSIGSHRINCIRLQICKGEFGDLPSSGQRIRSAGYFPPRRYRIYLFFNSESESESIKKIILYRHACQWLHDIAFCSKLNGGRQSKQVHNHVAVVWNLRQVGAWE